MMAAADKTRTQPIEKGWWSGERREAAQRIHQGVNRTEARGRHPVKTGGSQRRPTDPKPLGKMNKKKGAITIVRYYGKYEEKTVPAKT